MIRWWKFSIFISTLKFALQMKTKGGK